MAYDIYGSSLRTGHCEVHPHVHESYPCSVCLGEADRQQSRREQIAALAAAQYEQYVEDMIAQRVEELRGMYGDGI